LVYSLQFSTFRTAGQVEANRRALTGQAAKLKKYIDDYRTALSDEVFNSQEYSIKLIQIPKISNTNRNDIAVEFIKWNELSGPDKEKYSKVTAIIKDRVNVREAANAGRLKAGDVIKRLKDKTGIEIDHTYHRYLYINFGVRPPGSSLEKSNTNAKYCHYDEPHGDYVYQESWVDFLAKAIQSGKVTKERAKLDFKEGRRLDIQAYE
jgi:hypothetical protein